jgi:peptidoglycan lytic transglycosylase
MIVGSGTVCYYRSVRRLFFVIGALVLLSACGHKNVQVKAPQAVPLSSRELEGLATYYAEPYHGRKTASGEIFDTYKDMTAAHRTLPFNTLVRVTNKTNGREVDVRINDRGPFVDGRVIDLSVRAAREIDLVRAGVVPVRLTVLKLAEVTNPAGFAVQVAAFENRPAAEDLKELLDKKYSAVSIQTFTEEKTFYRVRIGEPNLESANKTASELRKQEFKPFIVRLN